MNITFHFRKRQDVEVSKSNVEIDLSPPDRFKSIMLDTEAFFQAFKPTILVF